MKSNLLIAFLIAAATATPALCKDKIKANNLQIPQNEAEARNQNQGTTKGRTKNVQSKPANSGTANSPLTNASKSGNARKKFNDTSQQIIGNVKQ
jgi:hypothetical protein